MSFRRILIAVDRSPISAHVAELGVALARSLSAELAFIHVLDPALIAEPEAGISPARLRAQTKEEGLRLLGEFQKHSAAEPPALEFLPVGKPEQEIVKAARDWPADIVVVGSHGRAGLAHLLVGSVAESVLRHAPCPVLLIPAAALGISTA
jgi:nucleotide-binding universal stress UspA family protein